MRSCRPGLTWCAITAAGGGVDKVGLQVRGRGCGGCVGGLAATQAVADPRLPVHELLPADAQDGGRSAESSRPGMRRPQGAPPHAGCGRRSRLGWTHHGSAATFFHGHQPDAGCADADDRVAEAAGGVSPLAAVGRGAAEVDQGEADEQVPEVAGSALDHAADGPAQQHTTSAGARRWQGDRGAAEIEQDEAGEQGPEVEGGAVDRAADGPVQRHTTSAGAGRWQCAPGSATRGACWWRRRPLAQVGGGASRGGLASLHGAGFRSPPNPCPLAAPPRFHHLRPNSAARFPSQDM